MFSLTEHHFYLQSGSVDSTVIDDVVQEKEMMIEQLNQQIEGLTLEVESLSDFQVIIIYSLIKHPGVWLVLPPSLNLNTDKLEMVFHPSSFSFVFF